MYVHYIIHFTARRYASAIYAMALCSFARLSIRWSQVGVVLKWLHLGSRNQNHTVAHGL